MADPADDDADTDADAAARAGTDADAPGGLTAEYGQKDLVVGVVGALVLTGLVVGLFIVRGVNPDPGATLDDTGGFYDVTFEEETHACADSELCETDGPLAGTLAEDGSAEVAVNLSAANVTVFTAKLTWPQAPGDLDRDEFRLEIDGPEGGSVACDSTQTGRLGLIELTCPGVQVPSGREDVAAASSHRAIRQVQPDDDLGATGTYTVTVTLLETDPDGDAPDPLDEDNDYTLTLEYRDYHGHAELSDDQIDE